MNERAKRPAARLLVLDPQDRLLMFRFAVNDRSPFWATTGGACDRGESYEAAARRELLEETGFDQDPGVQIARREVEFITLDGVPVSADERYFVVRVASTDIATHGHTELERRVVKGWRWFTRAELADWPEKIFPQDIVEMLDTVKEQAR